jgi:hypothetical protein
MAKKSMENFGHDKTSFANMPQDVHMSEYPKQDHYNSELDDTMTGIDEVVEHGKGKIKKHISNQK